VALSTYLSGMKTLLIFTGLVLFMVSCAGNDNDKPAASRGEQLIAQSDCLSCHQVKAPAVGPSYAAIAERYAGKPGVEDSLAQKIIAGGSGNWGKMPMTPHPNLSREDAREMVRYLLTVKP